VGIGTRRREMGRGEIDDGEIGSLAHFDRADL
jgi:hypothetical protein